VKVSILFKEKPFPRLAGMADAFRPAGAAAGAEENILIAKEKQPDDFP
jgi:hypothetical protein